ncbi:MAG: hypothetical protein AB8B48_06870 [Pseudomonadales bacterium]
MRLNKSLLLVGLLLTTSACATQPKPEEICTAEWIKPRVDSAMQEFRGNADGILSQLKAAGENTTGEDGAAAMLGSVDVLVNLVKLISTFQGGQTFEDLNTLSKTCNDPDLLIESFTGLLKEYDMPDSFISLLEQLNEFKAIAEDAVGDT